MADLEDFSPEAMADGRLGIFLMATYGEGEPTDNAAQFYKWLKNENQEIASAFLERFSFCVFGLGNRQYEHFNKMGKSVNSLLEKIGANRIFDLGEGIPDSHEYRVNLFCCVVSCVGVDCASSVFGER